MVARKGIILAGGSGTRLHPSTLVVSKQLLPIYDKPLIYYPLSTLMLAGIRDILVITTSRDSKSFQQLLGDGNQWGLDLHYAVQDEPRGLADAYRVGRSFVEGHASAMILGDNLYFGHGLPEELNKASTQDNGASVFAYYVQDPQRYGVVDFDIKSGKATNIEEKPDTPKSNWAVTGLYFYDKQVVDIAANIQPSARGEIEITDVNRHYLEAGKLTINPLGRGYAWFDTGTHESMLQASEFVRTIQARQGLTIACPEEIALSQRWTEPESVLQQIAGKKSTYYHYIEDFIQRRL